MTSVGATTHMRSSLSSTCITRSEPAARQIVPVEAPDRRTPLRGMHVIMDGVFNHVDAGQNPNKGFGYFWLWERPDDSPYIGNFAANAFFNDFDFSNECTNEFIRDVCTYWIDEYKIDGIRFDYVLGYYKHADQPVGISRVIRDLDNYAAANASIFRSRSNSSPTIATRRSEKRTKFKRRAAGTTNSCGTRSGSARRAIIGTKYVRALNSARTSTRTRVRSPTSRTTIIRRCRSNAADASLVAHATDGDRADDHVRRAARSQWPGVRRTLLVSRGRPGRVGSTPLRWERSTMTRANRSVRSTGN